MPTPAVRASMRPTQENFMATIAILMPGDMGHGVGQALIERGCKVDDSAG